MYKSTLFTTLFLGLAATAVPSFACQYGQQLTGQTQYRVPDKRMPLSAFMAKATKQPLPSADAVLPAADPSIVGLWRTAFVEGDMAVEAGFEQFGMGGAHVLNDPSPILKGNVCLGAWAPAAAPNTFLLNHTAYAYNDMGEEVVGIVHIYSRIVVDAGGDTFNADYKVTVQDMEEKITFATFEGKIVGKRVKTEDNPLK